uniref:GAF domain-containing protein n=1 Tax=Trichocoleus desertorum TaxID=1481672 RepID=UPI0025B500C2|nr:GAF domain-containing protein [Trichocoleus desertorum]
MNHQYALKQSSCLTLASTLLEFLTELPDLNLVLVSFQDPQWMPLQLSLDLKACSGVAPNSTAANSYFKFKPKSGTQQRSPLASSSLAIEEGNANPWLSGCLDLNHLPTHLQLADQTADAPLIFILGISDRFQVLWQAGSHASVQDQERSSEPKHQINLIYDAAAITKFCVALKSQASTLSRLAAALDEAIAVLPQANDSELQSGLSLRLLSALDANAGQPPSLSDSRSSPATNSQIAVEARLSPKTIYQQRHWLQQEKLLHELLHVSSSSLDPQTILRRSAEVIRTIFNVSRCLIAFYSPRDQRVVWGAIARSPELMTWDRHAHYPAWATVEHLIHKYYHLSTWVSDELPLPTEPTEVNGSRTVRAALSSWTQSHPKHVDKWVGGFLCIEQWESDRVWQSEEMYLLHMVIHQIITRVIGMPQRWNC